MTKVITITPEQLEEKIQQAEKGGFIPETKTTISKVKASKAGMFDVSYDIETSFLDGTTGNPISLSAGGVHIGKHMPHPDFVHAIDLLKPHLAIISDLVEVKDLTLHDLENDESILEKVKVTGFSISAHDITIEGYKILKSGKILPLKPPAIPFFEDYEYSDEVQHLGGHAANEALHYIKFKYAPTLFDTVPEEGEEELE